MSQREKQTADAHSHYFLYFLRHSTSNFVDTNMLVKCALIVTILGHVQAKPAEESFYLETRRAPESGLLPHRVGHDIIANWVSDWARQKASHTVIPSAPTAVRCKRHIDCNPSAVSAPPAVPNPSWFSTTTPAPRRVRFTIPPSSSSSSEDSEDEVQFLQEVEAPIQEVGRVSAQEAARAREQRLRAMSPAGSDIVEVPVEQSARGASEIPSPVSVSSIHKYSSTRPLTLLPNHLLVFERNLLYFQPDSPSDPNFPCCEPCPRGPEGEMIECDCDPEEVCHDWDPEDDSRPLPRSYAEKEARDRARWEQIRQRGDDIPSHIPTPRSDDPEGGDGNGRGSTFSCDARGHSRSRSRRDISYNSKILSAIICRGYAWLQSLEREKNSLLNHIY